MALNTEVRRPARLRRGRTSQGKSVEDAAYVGPGSNRIKKHDVDALLTSEPDIATAYEHDGWKAAAVVLYRDYLREEGLDPRELRGKNLICTCRLSDPCHADVLLELANGRLLPGWTLIQRLACGRALALGASQLATEPRSDADNPRPFFWP